MIDRQKKLLDIWDKVKDKTIDEINELIKTADAETVFALRSLIKQMSRADVSALTRMNSKANLLGVGAKKPHPGGRPTVLTAEIIETLSSAVRHGQPLSRACLACGIARQSVTDWETRAQEALAKIEKGEEPTENELLYIEFSDTIKKAEAEFENLALQGLWDESTTTWQRFAWLLERRNPDTWSSKINVKHSGGLELKSRLADMGHSSETGETDSRESLPHITTESTDT